MLKYFISYVFLYIFVFFLYLGIAGGLGGWALQYDIQFWASYFKQTNVVVPFVPCFFGGLFLSQFSIPIAILTWIISFFL